MSQRPDVQTGSTVAIRKTLFRILRVEKSTVAIEEDDRHLLVRLDERGAAGACLRVAVCGCKILAVS